MTDAPEGETYVWEESLAGLAERIGKELRHVGLNGDGRLAYRKQLVDEGEDHDEPYANGPSPEGAAWSGLVVMIVDDGPNLGIGTIYSDQSRFELHLLNENGVLLRVLGNLIVIFAS